jgi:hypothetical protein
MGFRSRRRHKGGGGHGGGHGGGGQGFAWTGEANGLQPGDDVGNRKSFKPVVVPPEDLGNRKDPDEEDDIPFDDVGNRVEANPTHEVSGILLDLDPKKRKRRAKGQNAAPPERIGRYIVGGVNPLIAGGNRLPPPPSDDGLAEVHAFERPERPERPERGLAADSKKRRFEQVDGRAAQEVSERRTQRFFDFEEDDRFDYVLKSAPDQKRAEALRFVDDVLRESGRNAIVQARIIEDGDKPKLLVTIEEKGPHGKLSAERIPADAHEPLFVMGNAALMSLNYLANKVVNRYPDDRIRLAVLPASDEKLYLESLEEHQRKARADAASVTVPPPAPPAPSSPTVESAPSVAVAHAAPVGRLESATLDVDAPQPEKRGRRRGREPLAPSLEAEPRAASSVDEATPAPAAPSPAAQPLVVPPVALDVVVAPSSPRVVQAEPAPSGRGRGGAKRSKRSEEVIPPPSALPPEPEPAVVEPPAVVDEAPRGRRRAPPDESLPAPRPGFDERGPPRGRPRRSPALVEVVRVTKKT